MIRKKSNSKIFQSNEQGNVTFMGILITLGIMTMLFSNWANRIESIKNQQIRMKGLLCFKEQVELYQELVEFIERANLMITAATPGLLIPKTAAISRMIIDIAKQAQNVQLLNTTRLNFSAKYCGNTQKFFFFKNIPYQTVAGVTLKRNQMQLALLKEQKWNYTLPIIYPSKHFFLSFSLSADFTLKHHSVLKVKTSEKTLKDLLSSK
jgi:hypothetical protein